MRSEHQQRRLLLCACCAMAMSAPASEIMVSDLRLGLDLRPTDFTFTASNELGTVEGDDTFESGYGTGLRGLYGWTAPGASGGVLLGGELYGSMYTYENGGDYQVLGARLLAGYGYAINDRLTVYGLAFLGYGLGEFSLPANPYFEEFTADGGVLDYGAKAGLTVTLSRHWVASAEVGWTWSQGDLSGGGFDVEVDEAGLIAFIGLGYRFGGTPQTLE